MSSRKVLIYDLWFVGAEDGSGSERDALFANLARAQGAAAVGAGEVEVFGQDVGQDQFLAHAGGPAALAVAKQLGGDDRAQALELGIVVEPPAVAGAREGDWKRRPQRGAGPG